ncbi:SusC/RagA family TonB-linked outer membrane protein [Niabella defluvii]|nr:SusC/RagA family TonB-linked outer membrane protein [Niabella sp. I65]
MRFERFNNSKTAAGNPRTVYGATYGINGSIDNLNVRNLLNENLVTFNRSFNSKHRIDAVAGLTMQRSSTEGNGFVSILVPNEVLGIKGLDQGTIMNKTTSGSYATLVSFLGRVNYGFNSRYLFTASFRSDGSSKFSRANRWGYFPSAAFAWNLGNESFLKPVKAISAAKLRLSYGITGNNRVSDFAYLSVLDQEVGANTGNTRSGYYFNGNYIKGTVPVMVGNENLKWERTANLDAGLDISFLKERISLTADYYYKRTTDLLLNASMPTSTGYLTAFKNIGIVSNRGLEFTLNTVNINTKNFTWSSNFNIAFNRNRIEELNGDQPSLLTRVTNWNGNFNNSLPYIALPGKPVALFYGYVFDGLYQLEDFNALPNGSYELKPEVPNNGGDRANIKPGFIKYKDINGDGNVDANDQTIIGNPNPVHIGGFSNNFRYHQFDLNVFLQWSYGNDVLNANRIVFEGAEARRDINMFKTYESRWSLDNQNSLLPVAGGYGPNVYSDRNIEDGSF